MNKSKKLRGSNQSAKEGQHQVKKQEKLVSTKVLMIASSVFVVILVGALLFDQLYERTFMTVDGEKYHMKDLSYYFYSVESQYDYYDQMFGGSGTYWDMSYDETSGETMRDVAKQEAVDSALYVEILNNEATAEGYTLTEEEKATVDTNVTQLLEEKYSKDVIDQNDFTKKYLTKVLSENTLVSRYRQDKIDALPIDDESIKAGISFEDYKQYDVEYLFIPTQTTDDSGNSVPVTPEEKTAAFDKINALYATAKTTEDWSTLIPEGETELTYKAVNFIETENTFDDTFEAQIMAMENNAITDVYEATSGYYILRMINNNSSERYDTTVTDAITSAENEGFNAIYEEVKAKHEYSINESALASITMGNLTLAK